MYYYMAPTFKLRLRQFRRNWR